MSVNREKFLSHVLDLIEQGEARLLTWGIVDGFVDQREIATLIEPLIDEALVLGMEEFLSASDVIQVMLERKWITRVQLDDGTVGYRSRMAETVRLLQRLRQLFPKHAGPSGWQLAPSLVADFRFLRRRREYPRRDVTAETALRRLGKVTSNSTLLIAAHALLNPGGQSLTLAGFQLRAAQRIIRGIEEDKALATIVCAGTGSGKTLAFYLPALASIVRHLRSGVHTGPWVKAVALYPRTELLKDQLREVLARSFALTEALPAGEKVTIRIGALFGDTPHSARFCDDWPKVGSDRVCPMLSCLHCSGEMRWRESDRSVGRERLECADCNFRLDGEIFPLTRDSIKKRPPDLLFTTTEMLNQRMADNSTSHLFGIGPKALRAPELVLMDEVHTYEGRHGAQVAYLMRRWQRMLRGPLRFVGLSATLREATEFFAVLTNCKRTFVDEVSPLSNEIESEGAEYLIALRGDPVSRTALLSTTIQTTMLLQRCLDPKAADSQSSVSLGAFGRKTFVFTDNLDVINRLYFDLLSAEGRTSSGAPDIRHAPDGGLAMLRSPGSSQMRYANGQDWRFSESLQDKNLQRRLVVKRVSSQDRGVDSNADVVVATAVLEVGFDDPSVGAVVQHKAPRGMASFLQRKGRAGRTRGMRPWTAVVLSDYGRDRAVYQSYDLLFDPELPVRTLPLSNRYLTRMQAVYATIDYLGRALQDGTAGSVWTELSGVVKNESRRLRLQKEIRTILESDNAAQHLANHLRWSLGLGEEEVLALLWEYPRPLMTTVLPSALRRLTMDWSVGEQLKADFSIFNNPLPDFIPATLFANLSLAEVEIAVSGSASEDSRNRETMAVFSALREFAPGRVSRRYGVKHRAERHWLPPSVDIQSGAELVDGPSYLEIDAVGTHVPIGHFLIREGDTTVSLPVWRPVSLVPALPPKNVKDSSNSTLKWHSQFVVGVEPLWLQPPTGSVWNELFGNLGFFSHARHAPLEVRRFAVGARSEIGVGQERVRINTTFLSNQEPVGLGANFSADAILFQIRMPEGLHARADAGSEQKWRALRTARFIDAAWHGRSLAIVNSPFMREWLAQIFLSAVTFDAIQNERNLEEAARALTEGTSTITLLGVLQMMFQSNVIEAQEDATEEMPQDRLRQDLEELLTRGEVVTELHRAAAVLWEQVTNHWEPWLRGVYQSTFASALTRSICDLCPTIDPDELHVDLDRGAVDETVAFFDPTMAEIWFTERGPGGNGLVEEFLRRYAEDPRRFFSLVRANLGMGEFEQIDHQLKGLICLLAEEPDSEVGEAVLAFRSARSQQEMARCMRLLRSVLVKAGFAPFHGFFASMGNRVLRQGSSSVSDQYLAGVLNRWEVLEERLGIEIDPRVMSYYLSQSDDIDRVIPELSVAIGTDRQAWRMSAIYGLLWARGRTVRQSALQLRNPFCELAPVERLLVIEVIADDRMRISVDEFDWFDRTAEELALGKMVTLTCHESQRASLGNALNSLVTNPIDAGYVRAFARLQGLRQSGNSIEADIELIEATQ